MCGRYAMVDPTRIRELREIRITPQFTPLHNIAITDSAPIVCTDAPDEVKLARWSITPPWAHQLADFKLSTFNATSEAPLKPTFAPLIRTQRCIVPASGFFEWPRDGRQKLATFIRPEDQDVCALAGLWADWTDPGTHEVKRGFTILTTQPNEHMRAIHNRMPVILPRSAIDEWLDPRPTTRDALEHLLVPYAGPMTSWRVTERVGNVRYKEADTTVRSIDPRPPVTLDLFGGL